MVALPFLGLWGSIFCASLNGDASWRVVDGTRFGLLMWVPIHLYDAEIYHSVLSGSADFVNNKPSTCILCAGNPTVFIFDFFPF